MSHETTSKSIDGITDLVVVAPIKQGFIHAYENVTYATRLRIVAEALNRVRVTAREHETITPFSDVTERILTLLDFRVGVIDKDVFALPDGAGRLDEDDTLADESDASVELESRRFLYLTATFDGAWEPYMRLIWDPLGPFLDLLFCNCEGYVTASEHGFDEYAQWVRDNQMDSAIFYATTGLTVRDHLYLNRLDQLQRAGPPSGLDCAIAGMTMPNPEEAAAAERAKARTDRAQYRKVNELALEALTVLYRLADYYPPEWLLPSDWRFKDPAHQARALSEGQYLVRASESLLKGWDELIPPQGFPEPFKTIYKDPLDWYATGRAYLRRLDAERRQTQAEDPAFEPAEIQGGILKPQASREAPIRQGALLLMTVADAKAARDFLAHLLDTGQVHFTAGAGQAPADGFYRTIALTADGLRRLGLATDVLDWFPKEFREGMEARSGLIGDMRENHPREWQLPKRNWPHAASAGLKRPPIETSEIDIALQIRTASTDRDALMAEIARLAKTATPGLELLGYELLHSEYDANGALIDHFGFHDGISQPRPKPNLPDGPRGEDEVRLGELLLGYRNDRDDFAPTPFTAMKPWRVENQKAALALQHDGTFLVIRKLEQDVDKFDAFIAAAVARINVEHPRLAQPMTPDRLKAHMFGRWPDGTPLIPTQEGSLNAFDYRGDREGKRCPLASHIRRVNPRDSFQGRRSPRLIRRGMSFDNRDGTAAGKRGLMFMAYNASIAEQYETIQRWINGGNSTFVASGHNDPVLGVAPRSGVLHPARRTFRFVDGCEVIRLEMPEPFVSLHWGLYLFVPSRTALRKGLCGLNGSYRPLREMREQGGQAVIRRLGRIGAKEAAREWKRLIEDFDAKDPAQRDISPDMWSAMRWYYGGSYRLNGGISPNVPAGAPLAPEAPSPWDEKPPENQPVVLSASRRHIMQVLSDWKNFTTEEQLRRIAPTGIPIYVTQHPENDYKSKKLRDANYHYRAESEATNAILMRYGEDAGFAAGYAAGKSILDPAKRVAETLQGEGQPPYFKMELRRQYLLPALGALCKIWYGVPDGDAFAAGVWDWQVPADREKPGARCPGDFLAPSRGTFYPRPGPVVDALAEAHGKALHEASVAFVHKQRNAPDDSALGTVAKAMFAAIDPAHDDVLARNLVGTLIGALPPMDGNLRGILLEWLSERTLWRLQAELRRALEDQPATTDFAKARAVLYGPVSQAMCKRPAPDLLYRTALGETKLEAHGYEGQGAKPRDVITKERDLVVLSLVSAAQRSLDRSENGDVSIVFGGNRRQAYESGTDPDFPVHACPAQKMAMGAIMGILAALLDAGRIQALPASLIVRISDW